MRFIPLSILATVICVAPIAVYGQALNDVDVTYKVDTKIIDQRAKALMAKTDMTGLAIATVEDGEISFAAGYGETIAGSGNSVTADTVFRWASVSKGIAAHVLATMAAEGKVSLDHPASDLAASLSLPPNETDVSISNLLAHQIGIVRNAYDTRIEDGRSAKETRQKLATLSYKCEPATCHTYQNVAYDSASEIIETLTGLPYKSVVQTEVFDKFGMETASVSFEGLHQSKNWARPHTRYGQKIRTVKPTYYRVPASAGVNSSVKDLARWMMAQMHDEDDDIQSQAENVQHLLQTPRVQTPREQRFQNRRFGRLKNAHYGMGFRIYDYNGHKVVGHRGGVEGYRALILFDPEKRSGIAMMWNSPHNSPIGLQLEFMDQLYGLAPRDWMRLSKIR